MARLLLGISLVLLVACARQDWIDRTLVTENVTGVWSGSMEGSPFSPRFEVMKVPPTGTYSFGSAVPIDGNVAGDVFTFRDQRGIYSGELTVGGDDMAGQILGQYGKRRASLHRETTGPQSDSTKR